jgi:hypothetical protein
MPSVALCGRLELLLQEGLLIPPPGLACGRVFLGWHEAGLGPSSCVWSDLPDCLPVPKIDAQLPVPEAHRRH